MIADAWLADVKAQMVEAGLPVADDVELMNVMMDAVARGTKADGPLPVLHMADHELIQLSNSIGSALMQAGMSGPALDEALSALMREAIRRIDAERGTEWRRRATMKVVA
jgi:hypothetical protein